MQDGITQRMLMDILTEQLGAKPQNVIDLGGGTGGLAAKLAQAGHRVVVVEPSPDALAAVERRAVDAGVPDRLSARQGDSTTLRSDLPADSADLVLCHDVLEFIEDPAAALSAMATVLRPGGGLSLLIRQRYPQTVSHIVAGDFERATQVWSDPSHLDYDSALALLIAAGFEIGTVHGLGLAASQVPDVVRERRGSALLELDRSLAADPGLWAAAPRLHLYATTA